MTERAPFDPPKALCEGLHRMFAEYSGELKQALDLLTAVQFERFVSSPAQDGAARETVYFSTLGAREFYAFMASLATNGQGKASDQQDYS